MSQSGIDVNNKGQSRDGVSVIKSRFVVAAAALVGADPVRCPSVDIQNLEEA